MGVLTDVPGTILKVHQPFTIELDCIKVGLLKKKKLKRMVTLGQYAINEATYLFCVNIILIGNVVSESIVFNNP